MSDERTSGSEYCSRSRYSTPDRVRSRPHALDPAPRVRAGYSTVRWTIAAIVHPLRAIGGRLDRRARSRVIFDVGVNRGSRAAGPLRSTRRPTLVVCVPGTVIPGGSR